MAKKCKTCGCYKNCKCQPEGEQSLPPCPTPAVLTAEPKPKSSTTPTSATSATGVEVTQNTGGSSSLAGKLSAKLAPKQLPPHVEVPALAGTGKTTTILGGVCKLKGVPLDLTPSDQQRAVWDAMALGRSESVRLSAFNTKITDTLKDRIQQQGLDRTGVEARGIHSLGNGAVFKAFGKVRAESYAVEERVCKRLGTDNRTARKDPKLSAVVSATSELVSLCKQTLTEPTREELDELCSHYDVEVNGGKDQVYDLVPEILEACKTPDDLIHFDDMVWLPVVHGLPIYKVDLQIVDECLPGWTPVMTDDGHSKEIQDIVVGDYVRSYDTATGKAQNCLVSAVQKIPNKKPLVKVKVKHNHKTAGNRKTNFVVCTTDHKIWTVNRGWVEAGLLQIGDTTIVETAAYVTQKGKISKTGRDHLSSIHIGNTKGDGTNGEQTAEDFNRVKGGNGRGPTTPQELLYEALGEGWFMEYPVKTGARASGEDMPTCYKIDIANPEHKVAIEIDGASHSRQKEIDEKKDSFLNSHGWRVFRITNRQIARDFAGVLQDVCPDGSSCPMPATVVEVEPTYITEHYVYDITVEKCHNFYANGILVHNCQDLNRVQQELMYRAGRRIVFVGDMNQAIYGFAGADAESMIRMKDTLAGTPEGCVSLPLTMTRRCGRAIVREAQRYVPGFEAHESNSEGKVGRASMLKDHPNAYHKLVGDGDMVLCRTNAPLVSECFKFLAMGKKANILGKKIGQGLIALLDKSKATSTTDLIKFLGTWLDKELDNEKAKKHPSDTRMEGLRDKHDCLVEFTKGLSTVDQVRVKIDSIFTDNKQGKGVTLSSIHKSKGLEANRVHFLQPVGVGPNLAKMQPWEVTQERNLSYVAVTRAIQELYYVS